MRLTQALFTSLLIVIACYDAAAAMGPATVLYEWVSVEYDWPSDAARAAAIASGAFIPENNVIAGMHFSKDSVRFC